MKVESVLDWTQAAEAGFKDMEGHFTEGEGARAMREVGHIWWCSPPCRAYALELRSWIGVGLFFSKVDQGVRQWLGVGILTRPQLSTATLEFTPVDERVASLRLMVMGGKTLCVCLCTKQ